MIKNKKGFTLIELLLALGLLGIVATLVFSLFITNVNNFERNQKRIEVQQNMRTAVEFISREALESKGIEEIKSNNIKVASDKIKEYRGKEIEIKYITFSTILEDDKYIKKTFKIKGDKLTYGHLTKYSSNDYTNMEVAFYISKIKIRPILDSLNKQKGITIKIYTDEKYDIKPITTSVYFRNMGVER